MEITICENHDYKVPLIWTFAFPGAEYWCPHCGYTAGMFGAGESVEMTKPLVKRYLWYKKYSKDYLRYQGLRVCCATTIKGERVEKSDIPESFMKRKKKKAENFKYKTRAKTKEVLQKEIDNFIKGCKDK